MSNESFRRRLLAAFGWLLVALSGLPAEAGSPASSLQRAVVCRVHNRLPGFANVGSGTLVDKTEDGREGLVLTCWHLFREGTGQVVVVFSDGRSHGARVVALDQPADLAALVIANPQPQPVSVNLRPDRHWQLSACGYGHTGQFRCTSGTYLGVSQGRGQTSLLISGTVRSGDSGGGVFDDEGSLVGVVWGQAGGVTYASYGQPLRNFLGRVLGRGRQLMANCPTGLCPRPQTPQPAGPSPGAGQLASNDARFERLAADIEKLRVEKQDRGDYLTTEDLERLESKSTARHESLLERFRVIAEGRSPSVGKAAGAAAVSLFGLSGPAGWAVLVAGTVGGWLLGRRMKRKLYGARGRRRPFRTK